jgi:hypothetical protein
MANCINCQTETKLHANGIPLCPSCTQTNFEDWKSVYAEGKMQDSLQTKANKQSEVRAANRI